MNRLSRVCRGRSSRGRLGRGGAFTVVELLVVISIIVILLVIAVPAFQAMIASSEDALSDSLLRSALKSGRDAAVQSGPGNDAAVVFFYEPGARLRAVTCVKATSIRLAPQGNRRPELDVFVPAPGIQSVQLPKHWMVRGAATNVGGTWYSSSVGTPTRYAFGATVSGTAGVPVNWVFPETAFYDQTQADAGLARSTFMIRFEGGTGLVKGAPSGEVLVVDPRPSNVGRTNTRLAGVNPTRDPWSSDLGRWAKSVAMGRVSDGSASTILLTPDEINQAMGRESSDMVLARPVSVIGLYDETKLASAVGVRLDRDTDTIYLSANDAANSPAGPRLLTGVDPQRVNEWMNGATSENGRVDYPEAKLFSVERFTGSLKRLAVQP